jgi:hypothetical protein
MDARSFLKSVATPVLIAIALVGCDSNPVAPIDPSERVFEMQEAFVQYQTAPAGSRIDLGTGIVASGRDTLGNGGPSG